MKLFLSLFLCACAFGQNAAKPPAASEPEIPADLTVAQLSAVIESQSLTIRALQARVNELERTSQLVGQMAANVAKMKAVCEAKKATLAVSQNGLYQPDKNGQPYCVPDKPVKEVKPKDGDKN